MTNPSPEPDVQDSEKIQPPSQSNRIMDIVVPKLNHAFRRASVAHGGQKLLWDAYLFATPNPMQPGNIITGLMIHVSIPSAIVGQNLSMTPATDVSFSELPQKEIDTWARERVADLIAARSQETMDQAVAEAAERNGHREPPAGGLIVPRSE